MDKPNSILEFERQQKQERLELAARRKEERAASFAARMDAKLEAHVAKLMDDGKRLIEKAKQDKAKKEKKEEEKKEAKRDALVEKGKRQAEADKRKRALLKMGLKPARYQVFSKLSKKVLSTHSTHEKAVKIMQEWQDKLGEPDLFVRLAKKAPPEGPPMQGRYAVSHYSWLDKILSRHDTLAEARTARKRWAKLGGGKMAIIDTTNGAIVFWPEVDPDVPDKHFPFEVMRDKIDRLARRAEAKC